METFPVRIIRDHDEDLNQPIAEMTNYCFQNDLSFLMYRIEVEKDVAIVFYFYNENDAMIFRLRF